MHKHRHTQVVKEKRKKNILLLHLKYGMILLFGVRSKAKTKISRPVPLLSPSHSLSHSVTLMPCK